MIHSTNFTTLDCAFVMLIGDNRRYRECALCSPDCNVTYVKGSYRQLLTNGVSDHVWSLEETVSRREGDYPSIE
jgi:hypothetical protein